MVLFENFPTMMGGTWKLNQRHPKMAKLQRRSKLRQTKAAPG
jgi:hypothetical protein